MDRNTVIGLTLIFILFIVWQWVVAPSPEEIERQKAAADSLARIEQLQVDSVAKLENTSLEETTPSSPVVEADTLTMERLAGEYGIFAPAAFKGTEQLEILENDLFTITFSSRGGFIKEVELKEHYKILEDKKGKQKKKEKLKLLEDPKNRFEYKLPIAENRVIRTSNLFFTAQKSQNSITLRANAGEGRYFEQKFTIAPDTYQIDYEVRLVGLNNALLSSADHIELEWVNYLDKLEVNTNYERNFSSVYFKPVGDGADYCSCRSSDQEDADGEPRKWVSHANQFFNTTLMAEESFPSGVMETEMLEKEDEDLKKLTTTLQLPFQHSSDESFAMQMYIGPNEFERLSAMGYNLYEVIPFGTSILGTINRWVIRPIFSFLSSFIGSAGLVILMLTFIVKLVLFPLTYKMLYSQSKMGALKPQLEKMRGKFKDDPQKQQMEQMKVYREFGVNPLGGCLPMVLQMPIWIALYRFFPASIEFRQAGFLWADDLSSYDVFFRLPFEIPFGFGSHISLFTLLWAITTLIYTYYNTKHMDMSANPAMKYMQYIMPLFFMGFFNSFASGLTCYLLFSNLLNITQTVVTKNVIIDQEKIKQELEANRNKPKKKGGFQERLEKALKEQQRIQAEKEAAKKKKRR